MNDGFVRAAAASPKVRVGDPEWNRKQMEEMIAACGKEGVRLLVFPELALTASTCGDLFFQLPLLRKAKEELKKLAKATAGRDMLVFAGLPWEEKGRLYNAAAAMASGKVLGLVPQTFVSEGGERYFTPWPGGNVLAEWDGEEIPMGTDLLFSCKSLPGFLAAAEVGGDLWAPAPPSARHALAGASVIVSCAADFAAAGADEYRRELVKSQSARLAAGYVRANAGEGESTQDMVFGGRNLIGENGTILAESGRFEEKIVTADLDMERLDSERRKNRAFAGGGCGRYQTVAFELGGHPETPGPIRRTIDPSPFIPVDGGARRQRCEEIFQIQVMGLKKRLEHTGSRDAVVGLSGGLDSTLALLVTVKAFDLLKIPRNRIRCITMPCFGTTDRTYQNACRMAEQVGAKLREIPIREAVSLHFRDIGHDPECRDVTYENSQARERTQVLMDVANESNALVIGTGDMSELALGWATYNGDHMSMYGVNASVPKTLVRHLVRHCGETWGDEELRRVLEDVLDTPVSPELLPPKEGEIAQKTEDLVGPYELHDFYLYYALRFGFMPSKIYRMAVQAFDGVYENGTILKWLTVFYRRFFSQQFKRSCLPDGPKVGSVSLSPRGDLRMPSDGVSRIWLEDLERIEKL